MSSTTPDLDAALLVAAQALPSHFESGDELTIETLSAIQATTLSLPGGAIAVESVIKGSDLIGAVIMVIPGLVNHKTGEIFSRDDARTAWTSALTDVLTALGAEVSGMNPGQAHDRRLRCPGQGRRSQCCRCLQGHDAGCPAADDARQGHRHGRGSPARGGGGRGDRGAQRRVPGHRRRRCPGGGVPIRRRRAGTSPQEAVGGAAQAEPDPLAVQGCRGRRGRRAAAAPMVAPVTLQPLYGGMPFPVDPRRIDLLRDVLMGVSVELGRTRMTVQEILGLTPGSIVELDRAAGAPVDVLINGKLIAHGEVVVVDEEFAVRISEVVGPDREGRVSA
ncbi:MAG: flagellar motor switch protein FliN [Austwickia sp.]|nr:flagellar motor switch protein FliN [Austwickia sp.]